PSLKSSRRTLSRTTSAIFMLSLASRWRMVKEIVFMVGKSPLEETGGGHSSYVRAHARAAIRAGFRPHLFGVGESVEIAETEYGVVHQLRSPLQILPYPH